jgi:hypothetical protein
MYRAIGFVLDFIHRLVCGRQKIPQRFGDWICLGPQVDGAKTNPIALYNIKHRQNPLKSTYNIIEEINSVMKTDRCQNLSIFTN